MPGGWGSPGLSRMRLPGLMPLGMVVWSGADNLGSYKKTSIDLRQVSMFRSVGLSDTADRS